MPSNEHLQDCIFLLTEMRYLNPDKGLAYNRNILEEDEILHQAFAELGMKTKRIAWDEPSQDWSKVRHLIIRTPWNYFDEFDKFKPWLEKISETCNLYNPKEIVFWNLDKIYLKELESKGIPIPATIILPAKEKPKKSLHAYFQELPWKEIILKPRISGAARETYRISRNEVESYEGTFAQLCLSEPMMLQEFQESILEKGEISLVFIQGNYSHAVLKKGKSGDFRVQDDFGGSVGLHQAKPKEINFGVECLNRLKNTPLYARVDIFYNNHNKLVLGELELIEPELWFRFNHSSARKLAKAVFDLKNKN